MNNSLVLVLILDYKMNPVILYFIVPLEETLCFERLVEFCCSLS